VPYGSARKETYCYERKVIDMMKVLFYLLFWPLLLGWWLVKFTFHAVIFLFEMLIIGWLLNGIFGCHCRCHRSFWW
jgi:hypothetical protein